MDGEPYYRLARLHPDGGVDTTFSNPLIDGGANPRVQAIAVQSDGKIII